MSRGVAVSRVLPDDSIAARHACATDRGARFFHRGHSARAWEFGQVYRRCAGAVLHSIWEAAAAIEAAFRDFYAVPPGRRPGRQLNGRAVHRLAGRHRRDSRHVFSAARLS